VSAIISVQDLSYRYSPAAPLVLKDINFEVQTGEFVAIMGPSGAGKSTLCLALNGIIPNFFGGNFYGQVSIFGQDTIQLSVTQLAQNIGMVLQDPEMQLVTNSVEDEVAFGLENIKVPRDEMRSRIDEALEIVRLTGYEMKHPATLSGGQKQRLAIAAALALRPKVMVLDEPTSQLDPIGMEEVFSIIRELNQRYQMTVLLVTHDSERVAEYADRVILMDDGQIVADCQPKEFFISQMLNEVAAIRLPQVTEFFAGFGRNVQQIPNPPIVLSAAREQLQCIWPEISFTPKQYTESVTDQEHLGEPLISARDLCFTYPDGTEALTGISLDIHAGECLAIIGQNGGGKSTLVKHFVRLLKQTSGDLKIYGRPAMEYSVGELARRIGFVYQNPDAQIFCKTVEEEVAFGPANQLDDEEEVRRRVKAAMADMDLEQFKDEHPLALSKGDRERVAVAAVLAMEPEIIIFDEPTTGQDKLGAQRIAQIIDRLHKQGRTVIVITHHLYLLPGYVDRVVLMGDGKILRDATLREVFHDVDILRETYLSPPQIVEFSHEIDQISGVRSNSLTVEETLDMFHPKLSTPNSGGSSFEKSELREQ
jgi:energy-coupling factor transport system ATP-binding protein